MSGWARRRGTTLVGEALLLALLVLWAHGPALRAGFVSWDDPEYVSANPHVQSHDPLRWPEILDPRELVVHDWTPVVTATHILERHLLGSDPAVYHATNLLLQLTCALATVRLLRVLGVPSLAALGAGAWYAVHPLQVESVAWVAARKNLLSTLFFLLAACVWLGGRRWRWAGAFAFFLVAIASKATAVVLPAFLVGVHLVRRERPLGRWALPLVPFLAIGLVRGLYSVAIQESPVQDTAALGFLGRMAAMGPVLVTYLRQVFWPGDLALLYPWPPMGFGDLRVLAAWVVVAGVVAATIAAGRRDRRFLEIGALVPVALFPTLNVLPAPFLQADRYVHLALVGVAGLIALVLLRALHGRAGAAAAVLAVWALALTPVTRSRSEVWRSGETLWKHALDASPHFAPGYSNLALDLLAVGRTDEAIGLLERAVELEPDRTLWRMNLGAALVARGDLAEGRALLEAVLDEDPSLADAHGTLAVIALREGREEEALERARRASAERPGDPLIEVHVAEALAALGRHDEAVAEYARIARAYPIAPVLLGWAQEERNAGRWSEAERLYARLLREEPHQADALYNLATLYLGSGRVAESLELYDRLVVVDPENGAAHNNRGNALVQLDRLPEAETAYRRAVAIAPDDPRFVTNLANVLASLGRCSEAVPLYEEALHAGTPTKGARLNRGACLLEIGRREEALVLLRELHAEGQYRKRIEALVGPAALGSAP